MTVRNTVQCEAVKTPSPADYKKLNQRFEDERTATWKRRDSGEQIEYRSYTEIRREFLLTLPRCGHEATNLIPNYADTDNKHAYRCVCDKHYYPRRSVVSWRMDDHPEIHELPDALFQQLLDRAKADLNDARDRIQIAEKRVENARRDIEDLERLRRATND